MAGKPSVSWGYNEILDMPDDDREFYVAEMVDLVNRMSRQ